MKFLKLKFLTNPGLKRYIAYAFGELILIVFGVLLALYINNRNSINKFQAQTDNNFKRTALEIKNNINQAKRSIDNLYSKDSLIYLVMNDLVTEADYKMDLDLAYLAINYFKLDLESLAFNNLILLSTTEDQYQEELINKVKELYLFMEQIKLIDTRMVHFVFEKSLPLLSHHISSFGDLTYKGAVQKDAINFFTNSREYKSLVSEYSIIAIKNQLKEYQKFYEKASQVYSDISTEYGLKTDSSFQVSKQLLEEYEGTYLHKNGDTLTVHIAKDTLSVSISDVQISLLHIKENKFISTTESGEVFFTFLKDTEKGLLNLRVKSQSALYFFQKIED